MIQDSMFCAGAEDGSVDTCKVSASTPPENPTLSSSKPESNYHFLPNHSQPIAWISYEKTSAVLVIEPTKCASHFS